MQNLENHINEFTKEITGHYTITIADERGPKRFTYYDHKIRPFENELRKHYGDKIVRKIVSKMKKAETDGKIRNFDKDDSADFSVAGEKVKAYFREDVNEDVDWKELPKNELEKRLKQARDFREYLKNRMENESKEQKKMTKRMLENIQKKVIHKAQEALRDVNEQELNEITAEVESGKINYSGDMNAPSSDFYKKKINSAYQFLKNSDDKEVQKLWKRIQASDKQPDFKPHPDGRTVMIMPDNANEKYVIRTAEGKKQEIKKLE